MGQLGSVGWREEGWGGFLGAGGGGRFGGRERGFTVAELCGSRGGGGPGRR